MKEMWALVSDWLYLNTGRHLLAVGPWKKKKTYLTSPILFIIIYEIGLITALKFCVNIK